MPHIQEKEQSIETLWGRTKVRLTRRTLSSINMLKKKKEKGNHCKDLKESMRMVSHQAENINEIEMFFKKSFKVI